VIPGATIDPARLTELQLDALREIANIGCGSAATALSELLGGRRVTLEVTRSALLSPGQLEVLLGGAEQQRLAVHVGLCGGFEGCLLLTYERGPGVELARSLAGGEAYRGSELTEVGCSVLMEVGNIVASAFLNGVGKVSGLTLLPSTPELVQGRAADVVQVLQSAPSKASGPCWPPSEKMLVLETRLRTEGRDGVGGHVIIVPRPESLAILLDAVGIE
jgi:chemotaxis protein CheC